MDIPSIVTGGGVGGFVLAVAYALKMWSDARTKKAESPGVQAHVAVTDAATANAVLMDTLKTVEGRLARVEQRADQLEDQVRALESQRVRDHAVIRGLWSYAQTLRAALVAADVPVPEPPGGIEFDRLGHFD